MIQTLRKFKYIEPASISEAASILAKFKGKAKIIAGGTDLLGAMKDKIYPTYPEVLVNIKTIKGLDYIKEDETFTLSILLPKSFSIIGASLNKSEMSGD